MGKPTQSDPLGQNPDPADFGEAMNAMIDARIDARWAGRSSGQCTGIADAHLVLELIARGWAVFRPITSPDRA